MAYQSYEEWKQSRGVDGEMWDDFSSAFLDCFFHQKLREEKILEFVNFKQGRMTMTNCALKFYHLSSYAPELVLECKAPLPINEMDIFGLVVYKQQVEED